jgi:hypothetical protein
MACDSEPRAMPWAKVECTFGAKKNVNNPHMKEAKSMTEVFAQLKPRQPRTFLPARDRPDRYKTVSRSSCRGCWTGPSKAPGDFERFLLDRSELEAALAQQQSILYIQMTCHTDDPGAAGAYQAFIEQVVPAVKPFADQLDRKCLEVRKEVSPRSAALRRLPEGDPDRYQPV